MAEKSRAEVLSSFGKIVVGEVTKVNQTKKGSYLVVVFDGLSAMNILTPLNDCSIGDVITWKFRDFVTQNGGIMYQRV